MYFFLIFFNFFFSFSFFFFFFFYFFFFFFLNFIFLISILLKKMSITIPQLIPKVKSLNPLKLYFTRNLSTSYSAATKNKKFNIDYQIFLSKYYWNDKIKNIYIYIYIYKYFLKFLLLVYDVYIKENIPNWI